MLPSVVAAPGAVLRSAWAVSVCRLFDGEWMPVEKSSGALRGGVGAGGKDGPGPFPVRRMVDLCLVSLETGRNDELVSVMPKNKATRRR